MKAENKARIRDLIEEMRGAIEDGAEGDKRALIRDAALTILALADPDEDTEVRLSVRFEKPVGRNSHVELPDGRRVKHVAGVSVTDDADEGRLAVIKLRGVRVLGEEPE